MTEFLSTAHILATPLEFLDSDGVGTAEECSDGLSSGAGDDTSSSEEELDRPELFAPAPRRRGAGRPLGGLEADWSRDRLGRRFPPME